MELQSKGTWRSEAKIDPFARLDHTNPVDVGIPIDARDINLVQETWARAARWGAESVGKVLFMQIFQLAPEAIDLFPFKDHPKHDLYKVGSPLISYGVKVFNTFTVAIGMLNDLPALAPVLQASLPRLFPGAKKDLYDIIGQACANSLAAALGEYWNDHVKSTWLKTWSTIISLSFPEVKKRDDRYDSTNSTDDKTKPESVPNPPSSAAFSAAVNRVTHVKKVENATLQKLRKTKVAKKAPEAKPGDIVPNISLDQGWPPQKINLRKYTKDKTVVILGLPGAFTPV